MCRPAILTHFPVSAPELVIALAVTAFAASLQSSVGVGFAIVSVPVLSLVDDRLAPVPQVLVVMPMVLWMAWRERHAIDLSGVGRIMVGRFMGAGVGLVLPSAVGTLRHGLISHHGYRRSTVAACRPVAIGGI